MKKSYSFYVYSADIYIICKHVYVVFVAFKFHRRDGARKNMSKKVSLGEINNKRLRNTEVNEGNWESKDQQRRCGWGEAVN